MPWIGAVSRSARAFDREAVATRPRDLGDAKFFRLTVALADFLRLTAFLATFFGLAVLLVAGFFLVTGFFWLAGFLLNFFFVADFGTAGFFLADFFAGFFFATGFFRLVLFREDFFAIDFFLVTLDFFPAGFFRDDVLRLPAFLREEAALVRFLRAAFLAAIVYSHRSEKNAELYIDCGHMEAQKQRFFLRFLPACSRASEASRLELFSAGVAQTNLPGLRCCGGPYPDLPFDRFIV